MARSSRLSVCLAIAMRNSLKIHYARSISRQRITPWLPESATFRSSGDGLALDVVELGGLARHFAFQQTDGPRSR